MLNAFRHQRMDHRGSFLSLSRNSNVLNAFRHQRMDHRRFVTASVRCLGAQRLSASTNGSRWTVATLRTFRFSAQRLSASTNGSPKTPPTTHTISGSCSTPFGINEWITTTAKVLLNGHPSAQRLSASTNGSQWMAQRAMYWVARAQRLSASTNGSP